MLRGSATGLLTYLLSFVYVGIHWNNHHHMFHLVEGVNAKVHWADVHLLFWHDKGPRHVLAEGP